jgi:glutamate dehydrogenase (NADP+)
MLETRGDSFEGKTCSVSGSGNVAQYTVEKITQLGGKVVTLSDSGGFIYDSDGINAEKLNWVKDLKNKRRGRISEYADHFKGSKYTAVKGLADHNPLWSVKVDCAFPCATQNELNATDAGHLVDNGVILVAEGANMPTTPDAVHLLQQNEVLFAPAKAANAGGVATSGLEMAQNSQRLSWTRDQVDKELQNIMVKIHRSCATTAAEYGAPGNYVEGANIAGFLKVATAMLEQGVV